MRKKLQRDGWITAVRALGMAATLGLGAATLAGAATARDGVALSASAADAWADDARLVWVENDTAVDALGQAEAWGYLYYSPGKHAMRSWSVREQRIVAAVDQAVVAEAPAVEPDWKDSGEIAAAALRAAADELGPQAALDDLLLVRGVFAPGTAWVAVFASQGGPRLFLLFDAKSGDLQRKWRG
jgi:hypothetical protein